MNFQFDRYTLNARLAPMLITLMPIGLAVISLFPAKSSNLGLVIGVVTYCGMLVLLSNMGRDLGRKVQGKLFDEWGGSPTSLMLDPITTNLASKKLAAICDRLEKLTETPWTENTRSDDKQEIIEIWTTYLTTNTRGRENGQFKLVHAENISFGFRRNLYGLRWIGIVLTFLSLAIVILDHTIITWGGDKPWPLDMLALRPAAKATILITVWTLLVFIFVVKKRLFAF